MVKNLLASRSHFHYPLLASFRLIIFRRICNLSSVERHLGCNIIISIKRKNNKIHELVGDTNLSFIYWLFSVENSWQFSINLITCKNLPNGKLKNYHSLFTLVNSAFISEKFSDEPRLKFLRTVEWGKIKGEKVGTQPRKVLVSFSNFVATKI